MFAKLALLAFLLTACGVGEVPSGNVDGGNDTQNQATFMSTMTPLVMPRCTGCHAGGTPPNLTSFTMLQPMYKVKPGASNVLVTKGDATAGMHQGAPYFSATEKMTVAGWIDGIQ